MNNFKNWLKKDWEETKVLFRCMPTVPFAFLVSCLIAMNFLANRGGSIGPVVFDCGVVVSWVAFLAGDMLVKRFGVKASFKIQAMALILELVCICLMTIGTFLPAMYGATEEESAVFTAIFRAAPWPVFAGAGAYIIAALFNALVSKNILTRFKKRSSFGAYIVASWTSTVVGQFLDNFLFSLFFSIWQPWFSGSTFGDKLVSAVILAFVGMIIELVGQAIFSPIGYKIATNWKKNKVGEDYVRLVKEAQEVNTDLA